MAKKKQKEGSAAAAPEPAAAGSGQAPATPHDSYFRYVFQQPEAARDLVLNVLRPGAGVELAPGDRVVAVEPQSLSFVDEELAEHRSDLLVTLRTASGRELAVHLLFEHKSRNDPGTIYQLMRYNAVALAHMAAERRKEGRRPPPIISVVLYNGPGAWKAATQLSDTLALDSLSAERAAEFSSFRYLVLDVGIGVSEAYRGGPVARTALQAMYSASRKLGREGVLAVVNSLNQASLPGNFREATAKYLLRGRGDNARMIVATMQEEGYTIMGATMISYAEELRREGRLEGEATGVKKGKAEALIRQMNRRFTLSASDLQKIRAVDDLSKLQAALDEIIEPNATRESVLRQLE